MKNSNETIWNRTRDLLACSAVPQPTALPRDPQILIKFNIYSLSSRNSDSLLVERSGDQISVKVKFTLEQATKSQRGGRGIVFLFL